MSYACETCQRSFGSMDAVEQHMNALDHWDYDDDDYYCNTCGKEFASNEAVEQHMDALGHWGENEDDFKCDRCHRTFNSWDACKQHMSALDHWFTDKCDTCDRRFANKTEAGQHMDSIGHRSSPYCSSCERYFQDLSDLYLHFNSPVHLRVDPMRSAPTPTVRSGSISRSAPVNPLTSTAVVVSSTQPVNSPYRAPHLEPVVITVPARPAIAPNPLILTPAVIAPQTDRSVLSNTWPIAPGTTCIPFEVVVDEHDCSSTTSHYQSITFMRPHQIFSFEELRLSDYRTGRKPTDSSAEGVAGAIYRDQATQTDIDTALASSACIQTTSSQVTTTGLTVKNSNAKGRDLSKTSPNLSLSGIEPLQTESVVRPSILSCPFCQSEFNAVWEVAEHLESSSCKQCPDLNRENIFRRLCQQDPDQVMTVQSTNRCVDGRMAKLLLYHCPNKAEICKERFMTSFAELLAHLENEICGFIKREDLWKDISECKTLWKETDDY